MLQQRCRRGVGMFPEDAVVDIVAADYVWELEWVSRAGVMPTVEISYVPSSRNLASGYWYTRLPFFPRLNAAFLL